MGIEEGDEEEQDDEEGDGEATKEEDAGMCGGMQKTAEEEGEDVGAVVVEEGLKADSVHEGGDGKET